jgi:hypothetical protein
MIKYHVVGLLCLAISAIAGIEAAFQFYVAEYRGEGWYSSIKGWLMVALVIGAVLVYFRARKLRKMEVFNRKP